MPRRGQRGIEVSQMAEWLKTYVYGPPEEREDTVQGPRIVQEGRQRVRGEGHAHRRVRQEEFSVGDRVRVVADGNVGTVTQVKEMGFGLADFLGGGTKMYVVDFPQLQGSGEFGPSQITKAERRVRQESGDYGTLFADFPDLGRLYPSDPEAAAKAAYEWLRKKSAEIGQTPDLEVGISPPGTRSEGGDNWWVVWEAGPHDWGVLVTLDGKNRTYGKTWYCETYYGFDLIFEKR